MRQTISGLVAAVAVMTAGAAPALACGFTSCSPYARGYGYGWAYERMAEPDTQYSPTTSYSPPTQYYYVNQGPTYSGPGMFAPEPTYQEQAVSYQRAPYYGYHRHHSWHHAPRHYGYHRYGYGYPLRRYY
jgi:hypothetical protein